jgi:hypothetical protein
MITFYFKDRASFEGDRLSKQELIDKIHVVFDEWASRLDGAKYHGGDELGPDACDFRMYSEISRVGKIFLMKGIINARPQHCEFKKWYRQMEKLCDQRNTF